MSLEEEELKRELAELKVESKEGEVLLRRLAKLRQRLAALAPLAGQDVEPLTAVELEDPAKR